MKPIAHKIRSALELAEMLPEHERIMVDVLRQVVIETLPAYCREKMSFNVPYFYGHRGICIIWPATVPRGGFKKGVLLGFWHGNKLPNKEGYIKAGPNKQVYYRIFEDVEEIDFDKVIHLLHEAIALDLSSKR